MPDIGKTVFEVAEGYLGLEEYPAARHNPAIIKMFADSGNAWVQDDETSWCAAFVGSVLAQCGLTGTRKLNARSYMDYGTSVPLENAQKGDIVVFWRESKTSWKGHVAFYSHHDDNYIYVLGGNQGNKVSVARYARDRLLGVRGHPEITTQRNSPAQSTTVQATVVQTAAAVGGTATALGSLEGTTQVVAIVACTVIAVAAMWILRERLKKWAAGDR